MPGVHVADTPEWRPKPRLTRAARGGFRLSTWDNATRNRACKVLYTGSIPVAASMKN